MQDVPTYLHQCYDITTPSGQGGDPFNAKLRSEVFKASLAFVHSGMKDLMDKSEFSHHLLMYCHTTPPEMTNDFYKKIIVREMLRFFYFTVSTKGKHAETIDKIPKLCDLALDYSRSHIIGCKKRTKEEIAQLLNVTHWHHKDRGTKWNEWFDMLSRFIQENEKKGIEHMEDHLIDFNKERFRIKEISSKAERAFLLLN